MKNMMKKRTYILTTILGLAFTFTACGSAAQPSPSQQETAQTQDAASAQDGTQVQDAPPIQTTGTLPDGTQTPATLLPDGTVQISQPSADNAQSDLIGEDKALQIALEHAGIQADDVAYSHVKLETDDDRWEYNAEFYSGSKEYDYEIDASTGEILGYDHDIESVYLPPADNTQAPNASVSLETAKSSALAKVPGAGESNIRIKQDYDDGRLTYEGKIIYNTMEYEFEIDAATGAFLEWSAESIYD